MGFPAKALNHGPPLNHEELALAAKVLNAHASVLAAAGRLTEILSDMQTGMEVSEAVPSQDLLQNALSIGKHVAEIQLQVQEVMKSLQASGTTVPTLDLPPPLFSRLQEGLTAVRRFRSIRMEDIEARVGALELAVTKLQQLLEDPDLPEETKDEIRKLLKDIGGVDYIR